MVKLEPAKVAELERDAPGFQAALAYYEALRVPPCPTCGSGDTATVVSGVIGRTINLAAATTKIKLRLAPGARQVFCNSCERFF